MNDESFLNYVTLHSESPRALFSCTDAQRLCTLAGVECSIYNSGFIAIHEDTACPLVEKARKRLQEQERPRTRYEILLEL